MSSLFGWSYGSALWHGFSVVLNSFHVCLLLKVPGIGTTPCGKVLLAITLTDIYFSTLKILADIPLNLSESNEPIMLSTRVLGDAFYLSSIYRCYYISASACIERFMALCFPFKHITNWLVTNLGKIMMAIAIFLHVMCCGLNVIREIGFGSIESPNEITEDNLPHLSSSMMRTGHGVGDERNSTVNQGGRVTGEAIERHEETNLFGKILFQYEIQLFSALLVVFITVPLTFRELLFMRNVRVVAAERSRDRKLIGAVIYITIISVISVFCLIPVYILRISRVSVEIATLRQILRFLQEDAYGILNVNIYGIMNKQYRQTVKSLFKSCLCHNQNQDA